MIRAALGRFFQSCIRAAEKRRMDAIWDRIDLTLLDDEQLSQVLHGRPLERPACERRKP